MNLAEEFALRSQFHCKLCKRTMAECCYEYACAGRKWLYFRRGLPWAGALLLLLGGMVWLMMWRLG